MFLLESRWFSLGERSFAPCPRENGESAAKSARKILILSCSTFIISIMQIRKILSRGGKGEVSNYEFEN
jgi:hypothetical protein